MRLLFRVFVCLRVYLVVALVWWSIYKTAKFKVLWRWWSSCMFFCRRLVKIFAFKILALIKESKLQVEVLEETGGKSSDRALTWKIIYCWLVIDSGVVNRKPGIHQLSILWMLDKSGDLLNIRNAWGQCGSCNKCKQLEWSRLHNPTHWCLSGRCILGKILGFSCLQLCVHSCKQTVSFSTSSTICIRFIEHFLGSYLETIILSMLSLPCKNPLSDVQTFTLYMKNVTVLTCG